MIVYAHYRMQDPKTGELHHSGGVTMCADWEESTGRIVAAGAGCILNDNYCYRRGRQIAEGRLKFYMNSGQMKCQQLSKGEAITEAEVHDFLSKCANSLFLFGFSPKQTKAFEKSRLVLNRFYRSSASFVF